VTYTCAACGQSAEDYVPECPGCGAHGTLRRLANLLASRPRSTFLTGPAAEPKRISVGLETLDRAFGRNSDGTSGLVLGAVYLLHGGPGAGKSTLALHIGRALGRAGLLVLGVSTEADEGMVLALHQRTSPTTGQSDLPVRYLFSRSLLDVLAELEETGAEALVVDQLHSLMGSPKRNLAELVAACKVRGATLVCVAERNGAGTIRGERAIEHMDDCTVALDRSWAGREDESAAAVAQTITPLEVERRIVSTSKNRWGPDGRWSLRLGATGWDEMPAVPTPAAPTPPAPPPANDLN